MIFVIIATLGTLIFTLLLKNFDSIRHYLTCYRASTKLPTLCDKAYPILGHVYLLPKNPLHFLSKQKDIFLRTALATKAKIIVMYLGIKTFPNLVHPDAAEVILRSSVQIQKPSTYPESLKWTGDGLLVSKGQKWFQRRRLITPAFHFNILEQYMEIMNNQARILINKIEKKKDNPGFELSQALQLCTLDIICETAMGCSVDAQSNEHHAYVQTLGKVAKINTTRTQSPLLSVDFIYNLSKYRKEMDKAVIDLQKFTLGVIEERMKSFDVNKPQVSKRMAFMDILMHTTTEDGKRLSVEEIREEVDTFMTAGHDTNAAALAWVCYLLSRNPKVQKKVQDEVDLVFNHRGSDELVTEDLRKFHYLEMVVKEALRLYPPAAFIGRRVCKQCEIDGYTLPVGYEIYINIMSIHHHPEVWEDPERFDPERFSKDRSVGRHPYAFIPFSAGPRNCIGQRFAMQEQKVVIAHIMRNFNLKSDLNENDVGMHTGLVTRIANFRCSVTRRNGTS